jgi:hypothetical protein
MVSCSDTTFFRVDQNKNIGATFTIDPVYPFALCTFAPAFAPPSTISQPHTTRTATHDCSLARSTERSSHDAPRQQDDINRICICYVIYEYTRCSSLCGFVKQLQLFQLASSHTSQVPLFARRRLGGPYPPPHIVFVSTNIQKRSSDPASQAPKQSRLLAWRIRLFKHPKMSGPHPLDLWYSVSGPNGTLSPFCESLADCLRILPGPNEAEYSTSSNTTSQLAYRLQCTSHVSVPQYYRDFALLNATLGDVTGSADEGNLVFVHSTCACDPIYGLTGDKCEHSLYGSALILLDAVVSLWILGQMVAAISVVIRGKFESKHRKYLAGAGGLQYISQLVWIWSRNASFVMPTYEQYLFWTGVTFAAFSVSNVALYMFMCGMVQQTVSYLQHDFRGSRRLKTGLYVIDKVFTVLPVSVGIFTGVLISSSDVLVSRAALSAALVVVAVVVLM